MFGVVSNQAYYCGLYQVCTVDNQELKTSEKLRTNINPSFAHKFFTQISDDDDYPIEFEEGLKLEDLFDEVQ